MVALGEKDFILHPICVVPPERHYDSCKELKDDLKWFEESRAYFYKLYPEFKPKEGQFEQIKLTGKKGFILLPTSLDYGVLYRGQGQHHRKCLPSLYRDGLTEDKIFVEHVRIAEFRLFLEQFEITRHFEECGYVVDYVGLAQHYGLKTDVLDVTSDIDVSMFFAMCDYDKNTDTYKPKTEDKEYIGYIYAVLSNERSNDPKIPFGVFSNKIDVIGLQPFLRPGRQKGYAYHVGKEGMLRGFLYSFSYTKEDSEAIYNHYHQGGDLWCKDDIVDTAKAISVTNTFSSKAVSLAVRMFGGTKSINMRIKSLKSSGFSIINRRKLPWYSFKKPLPEKQWIDIQQNIVARKYVSDKKDRPYLSTQQIGQELLFNYIYGCVDSPVGYDSGLCFMEGKESSVWGIQNLSNKNPLSPGADDKIHAKWYEDGNVAPRTRSFQVPDSFRSQLIRIRR